MYFRNYEFRKTLLDKCLKSHVSVDRWKSNMVNGPKNFSNLNHNTFSISIDHCEHSYVQKSLS